MIATRFSSVWQAAGVAAAALCCYLVSQSVAAERAALAKVDRQIAQEQDAVVKLTTEITTRSRLTQIESWNRQLALQAPRPGQYVDSGFQLASLYAHDAKPQLPLDPAAAPNQGPVQMASYAPPAAEPASPAPAHAAAPPAPVALPAHSPVQQAAFHAVAPVPSKPARPAATDAAAEPPLLHVATFVRARPSRLDDPAGSVTDHVAYHPAAGPLLSADIASLAKAEQAKRDPGKPAR